MMVLSADSPDKRKKEPTFEERALAITLVVMENTKADYVPKAEFAVTVNRLHDRPLQHLFYDGWRDGLAYAIKLMLSGELDIKLIEREKDREADGQH